LFYFRGKSNHSSDADAKASSAGLSAVLAQARKSRDGGYEND
jgi:hypothetical protein